MDLIVNSYLCKGQLISYLVHNRTNLSYQGFLNEYHDIIYIASLPFISTLSSSNWKTFDDYWALKFLDEANDLIKEKKILKKSTIDILKEKINKERSEQKIYFQIYWQEVIKSYKAKNLIPGATYTKKKIEKALTKDNINPDLMFCYNILYEIENTIWAYPFYKFDKELDIYNQIINPMDLFTINLKLENNQYSSPFEFKDDMNLIFKNCEISNDIGTEMFNLGNELNCNFRECWNVYYYQKTSSIFESEDIENSLYQQLIQQYHRLFQFESENIESFHIEPEDIELEDIELEDIESEDIEPEDIEPEDIESEFIELENKQKEQKIPEEVEQECENLYQQLFPEEVEQECEDLYQQLFLEEVEQELFSKDIELEDIEPDIESEDFLYQQFFQIESEDKQKEQEIPEEVEQECDENSQIKQQIEEYDKIQIEQEYQNQIDHQEIISQINEIIFQIEQDQDKVEQEYQNQIDHQEIISQINEIIFQIEQDQDKVEQKRVKKVRK